MDSPKSSRDSSDKKETSDSKTEEKTESASNSTSPLGRTTPCDSADLKCKKMEICTESTDNLIADDSTAVPEKDSHTFSTVLTNQLTDKIDKSEEAPIVFQNPELVKVETDCGEASATTMCAQPVDVKVIYNKKKYDLTVDMSDTILALKSQIEELTGVPVATQKVMYRGSTQDTQTMMDLKVTKHAKFMVVGSSLNDLLKVTATVAKAVKEEEAKAESTSKEPFCKQAIHKKVLDKYGKPEDVTAGIKGTQMSLPPTPLSGMYNKAGSKTRLTFKLDQDELWIGTKERTQKIRMGSIKNIVSEPIIGHEEFHLMGIQLGPTEASRYWIYWVPAQYISAIKDTVLGKWDFF